MRMQTEPIVEPQIAADQIVLYVEDYATASVTPYEVLLRPILEDEREIASIIIRAYSDTVGTSEDNVLQPPRYAEDIRDWGIAEGLASDAITAIGLGELELDIPTEDEVDQPLNRRVVIEVTYSN